MFTRMFTWGIGIGYFSGIRKQFSFVCACCRCFGDSQVDIDDIEYQVTGICLVYNRLEYCFLLCYFVFKMSSKLFVNCLFVNTCARINYKGTWVYSDL